MINDVASGFKFENHRKTSKNTASALTAGAQIRCAKRAVGQNKWVEYFLGLEKIFVSENFRDHNFLSRNRVSPHTAFICLCGASPHSLPGRPLTNDSVNENWYCESGLHSGLALPEPIDHFLTYHAGNAAASKTNKHFF